MGLELTKQVHVQDVADLILLSLEHNLAASTSAGFERFYL